ncbi:FtsX-like permease family protein [Blastococcus sp. Marseille-P5729]|uniref:FtsX-like permease family protein n=1 Tax=Blastococcus sp. Marseille-P5729 TaxID=2086582 RepID=UPI000D0EE7A6|nr:ABC transporter permease [Blastococcus sp. Marseille-P5729]
MSVTTKAAFAELKHKPGRLAAVMLAIIIGSLFAVATTVFSSTAGRAIEVVVAESIQNADVVVGSDTYGIYEGDEALQTIESTDGVEAVAPIMSSLYQLPGSTALSGIRLTSVIDDKQLAYEKLAEGSFPTKPTEIALDPETAKDAGAKVGDQVTLRSMNDQEVSFTVTGITDPNPTTKTLAGPTSWVTLEYLKQDDNAWLDNYLVRTDGNAEQVAAALNSKLPDGLDAKTGVEAREAVVDAVSGGTVAITVLLGAFAVIALAVAAIVIANTFAILLAQRRRQIALQRLVGATAQQMKRQILLEALLIGMVGTVIGVGLGILAGYVGASAFGAAAGGLAINPVTVLIACAATIAATVVAAYFPIRRACQTSPMEALRPVSSEVGGARLSRTRIILSAVLVVIGLAVLALGAVGHQVAIATLGGLISVVGVLVGAQLLVVPMGRLLRPIGSALGTPGKIAARDVTRHAARATNTVVAIIVGIGLISMIQVASQVTRASALADAKDSELRQQIEAIIDIMTNVATGLLAVAAIIAVVGIANTLALSVIERKRESGLMRALGVQKGQLRAMVSVEAVILSLIGGLVGILLGIFYGMVAAYTVIGSNTPIVWDIPWGRLAIFLGIAVVGGLVASVLPALRSGRVSPVEALATA